MAINIAEVGGEIALSKIEKSITSLSADSITSALTTSDIELEATIDQILQVKQNVSAKELNPDISLDQETLNSRPYTLLEVYEDEEEKIVTYQVYNKRVTLQFYKGRDDVSKSVSIFNSDGTMSFENSYNNEIMSREEYTFISSIPEETADFENIEANSNALSTEDDGVVVDPHPFDFQKNRYVARLEGSGIYTVPALRDLGLDASQMVKIYSSATGFEEVRKDKWEGIFEARTHINALANFWNVGTAVAKGFLKTAGVILDIYSLTTEKVTAIKEHQYIFSAGLESTIYDPTREHEEVEVINDWDQAVYTLGWDAEFGSFENAEWKVTSRPFPWETTPKEALQRTVDLYDAHIAYHGVWLLGVGRLGY